MSAPSQPPPVARASPLPMAVFNRVAALGRMRLRNRVAVERPVASRDGPTPRNGSSMVGARGCLWVFGGRVEKASNDSYGNPVTALVLTNECYSFNVKQQLWSWHGCFGVGSIPSPRWRHGCGLVNDGSKMVIVGGALDIAATEWAPLEPFIFDTANEVWTQPACQGPLPTRGPLSLTPLPSGQGATRFLALGKGCVFEGAWDGETAWTWAETRAIPRPRADWARQAAVTKDLIIV